MKKRPGPATADEYLAELAKNPEYQYQKMLRDQKQRERAAWVAEVTKPILSDLEAAGYRVRSVTWLANLREGYKGALPVLLRHLLKPYPEPVRTELANLLAVKDAAFAWEEIVSEYKKTSAQIHPNLKRGLTNAVAATADRTKIPEIVELLKDRSNGKSRLLLLLALRRIKDPAAKRALVEFTDEPDFQGIFGQFREMDERNAAKKLRKEQLAQRGKLSLKSITNRLGRRV